MFSVWSRLQCSKDKSGMLAGMPRALQRTQRSTGQVISEESYECRLAILQAIRGAQTSFLTQPIRPGPAEAESLLPLEQHFPQVLKAAISCSQSAVLDGCLPNDGNSIENSNAVLNFVVQGWPALCPLQIHKLMPVCRRNDNHTFWEAAAEQY